MKKTDAIREVRELLTSEYHIDMTKYVTESADLRQTGDAKDMPFMFICFKSKTNDVRINFNGEWCKGELAQFHVSV